jgi:DNA-binding FadR family transcriptional regulator
MASPLGHKKALQAVEVEAYRQIMSGAAPATLMEFARQLLDWIRSTHPDAASLTLTEVERQVSETWHRRHELIRGGD